MGWQEKALNRGGEVGFGMQKCHAAVLIVAVDCSKQTFLIVALLENSFFSPSAFQQCFKELKSSFRAEVPLPSLLAGMPPEIG